MASVAFKLPVTTPLASGVPKVGVALGALLDNPLNTLPTRLNNEVNPVEGVDATAGAAIVGALSSTLRLVVVWLVGEGAPLPMARLSSRPTQASTAHIVGGGGVGAPGSAVAAGPRPKKLKTPETRLTTGFAGAGVVCWLPRSTDAVEKAEKVENRDASLDVPAPVAPAAPLAVKLAVGSSTTDNICGDVLVAATAPESTAGED